MAVIAEGTSEWFKRREGSLVADARAFDSISAAKRANDALLAHWDALDLEIHGALHTQAVISYARPFTNNMGANAKTRYPTSHLRRQQGFSREFHVHLMELRDKLIAHSDASLLDGRVAYHRMTIRSAERRFAIPIGTSVHVMALHTVQRKAVVQQFDTHASAALAAIHIRATTTVNELLAYIRSNPNAAFERSEPMVMEVEEPMMLPVDGPVSVPIPFPSRSGELDAPKFAVAEDGYLYRQYNIVGRFDGELPVNDPLIVSASLSGSKRAR
jgi:hypothetical protein